MSEDRQLPLSYRLTALVTEVANLNLSNTDKAERLIELKKDLDRSQAISHAYEIQRAKMKDRIDELTKALAEVDDAAAVKREPHPGEISIEYGDKGYPVDEHGVEIPELKDCIETEDMTVVERLDRIERNMIFS